MKIYNTVCSTWLFTLPIVLNKQCIYYWIKIVFANYRKLWRFDFVFIYQASLIFINTKPKINVGKWFTIRPDPGLFKNNFFVYNNIMHIKNVEESRQPWAGVCLSPIVFFQKVWKEKSWIFSKFNRENWISLL